MNDTNITEELPKHLREYVKIQYEIQRLKLAEKAAQAGAAMSGTVIIGLISTFALLFLSLGAGFLIANRVRSYSKGFLIIGGIYVLAALLCIVFRKKLLTGRIRNRIIREILH